MSEDPEATKQLMAEKDALVHQMMTEIQTLQKNASEKEKTFCKDLEDLKDERVSNNQQLVTKHQAEEEPGEQHQDKIREQDKEKEALEKEVEELEAKLQSAETLSGCQEKKVKQLTELKSQVIETDTTQKQVETNKLLQEENSTAAQRREGAQSGSSVEKSYPQRSRLM
ncbi:hypothetical protein VZT92_024316 [Zoarces viviparus]|uniref:Uncharacterized protein n=1 Tax=Zoarces viviparus TaxID=48416 RepID=A0AAW1E1L6_ZOAVI